MAEGDKDDKELPATQRRLEKARESGNVPNSREASAFAALAFAALVLIYYEPAALRSAVQLLAGFIAQSYQDRLLSREGLRLLGHPLASLVAPVLAAVAIAGALAVMVQTRMLLHTGAVSPDLSRVSPVAGLKRIFGLSGLTEMVKSVLKLAIGGGLMWLMVRPTLSLLLLAPRYDPRFLAGLAGAILMRVLLAGVAAQAAIGIADLVWTLFKHQRDLRMSKQDVRDEYKETEGNPLIKSRIRAIGRSRIRRSIFKAVPEATVVVTNPTHYAVALAYDRDQHSAPRLVAKGADDVAAQIRELARAHDIPLVPNPPLARELYRLEVDSEIPAEHYKAVAEIIAFVWRLRESRKARRLPPPPIG